MTLTPLLTASPAIQLHVAAALIAVMSALCLALYRKGTPSHRWLGRIVIAGLAAVSLSSFAIREINHGSFSWIHILSVVVLFNVWRGVRALRQNEIRSHMWIMSSTAVLGLGVAGAFTFLPYRLMWQVFNG